MSRLTLWEWKQDPGFRAWLRAKLDQTSDEHWPLILRRHELLAIQGSVKSAEFIGRVRSLGQRGGGFNGDETVINGDVVANYSVNLLVPRPPALEGATS